MEVLADIGMMGEVYLLFFQSRRGTGIYRISFSSSNVPSGYKVFTTGYGYSSGSNTAPVKATITSINSTYFDVYVSDDASNNDGSFEFMIYSPNWWYNMQ